MFNAPPHFLDQHGFSRDWYVSENQTAYLKIEII